VICKLQRILKGFTSLAAQRVFFDDANNATCKSRVGFNGLPYSVTFPCCRYERTIFGFACERTRGAWIHACDTTVQYRFVSHCCDVILLCIVSQISNKKKSCTGFTVNFVDPATPKMNIRPANDVTTG